MPKDKYSGIFSPQMEAIVSIFLNFQNRACWETAKIEYFSVDIICSSKLTVFLELLSRKLGCSLLGTDDVRGQMLEHICVQYYYSSNLFRNARIFENWGILSDIPQFQLGIFGHVTCLDQSSPSGKYLMDYNTRIFPSFSRGIFSHVIRLDESRASDNIWWITTGNRAKNLQVVSYSQHNAGLFV